MSAKGTLIMLRGSTTIDLNDYHHRQYTSEDAPAHGKIRLKVEVRRC
jgi:hypothetical protein